MAAIVRSVAVALVLAACGGSSEHHVTATPRITTGVAEVRDGLTRDEIRATLRDAMPDVAQCVAADTNGEVRVDIVVQPDGSVSGASVAESTLGDAAAEACIVERARSLRFRSVVEGGGGVTDVHYPFRFGTAASDEPALPDD